MEIGDTVIIKWSMSGWMRREGRSTIFKGIIRRITPTTVWITASEPEYVRGDVIPIHRENIERMEVIKYVQN